MAVRGRVRGWGPGFEARPRRFPPTQAEPKAAALPRASRRGTGGAEQGRGPRGYEESSRGPGAGLPAPHRHTRQPQGNAARVGTELQPWGPHGSPHARSPLGPWPHTQEASLPKPPLPLFRVVLEAGGVKSSDSRRNGRGWGSSGGGSVAEVLVKAAFSPEGAVG